MADENAMVSNHDIDKPKPDDATKIKGSEADRAKMIDILFRETFASSTLATHTDLYNEVHAFKEKIKSMVA